MRPANLIKIAATVCCGWLVASAASGAGVPGVRILAYEPLELRSTTGALGSRKSGASHAQEFEFDAYGRRFAGELTRNHRLDAWSSAEATAYRGTLAGQPGSWVRLTHSGEVLHGMIWDGRELYVIAPGADSADALVPPLERPDGSIIFRLVDTLIESPAGSCVLAVADDSHFEPGDAVYTELIEDLSLAAPGAQKPGAVREISVSLLADSRFLRYAGSAAHASDEILARLNNVDGIFSGQLGLQVGVASLEVYDTTSDPFSTTTNASTLLRELASVRRGNPDLRSSGLTHLFTGRDFDGDTVGVAYLDAVCDPQLGAGITELRGRTAFYESLITAHEIGHNFGAPHDGEEGPCLTTPESFLMSARLNGSDTFSACSLDQIGPRIAGATCIRALPAIDLAASAATASRRILAGRDASFEFAITNVGGSQATVARAIVTASGAGIEIVDVAVSQGTCTKSVVAAICDIAEVAPDSPVDLTVTARSSQVTEGTIGIEAESTSTDANAANDAAVTRVSVENGTDLVVTLGAPSPVDVERAFDLEASLENRASIAATNAVMAVEVPAQIAIVSASLPGGTCTVAPASVRCEQAVIDAGRRITATIALRATSAGALRIAATGRADQLELTPADNEASLTVSAASAVGGITTTTNEGGGGGGGGGRVTPALLLLLLSAAAISRSARAHAARARTPSSQRSSDLGSRAPD